MDASKCVTGATGFIGEHLTARLVAMGHVVRGTTRDTESADASVLRGLPHAGQRLELVKAGLLELGSFDRAFEGCDTVFHFASPFVFTATDPEADLVVPAVEGTLNVLRACLDTPTVDRVTLTPSITAVVGCPDGTVINEDAWNTYSAVDNNPYCYARTQTEKAAWRFMEENHPSFDLVAINPGQVLGPSYRSTVGTSFAYVRDLMIGAIAAITDLDVSYVDVRDVAETHMAASEAPDARGRYLCVAGVVTTRRLVEVTRRLGYASCRFPRVSLDSPIGTRIARVAIRIQPPCLRQYLAAFIWRRLTVDNAKIAQDLRIGFCPLEDTIEDLEARNHTPAPH